MLPRRHPSAPGRLRAGQGHDGLIHVWPRAGFAEFLERIGPVDDTGRVRSFRRSLTSTASDQSIDRPAGRHPGTAPRVRRARPDVVVTGADDHLELWSPEAWTRLEADDDEMFRKDEDLDAIAGAGR